LCHPEDISPAVVTERTQMIKIKSRGNETAEQMLRRFKKMCEKEGLTKDIKRIAYYEKPSEKRRRKIRSKPRLKPMGR
jgi:small subunit ribosomal protein S21